MHRTKMWRIEKKSTSAENEMVAKVTKCGCHCYEASPDSHVELWVKVIDRTETLGVCSSTKAGKTRDRHVVKTRDTPHNITEYNTIFCASMKIFKL